MKSSGSFFVRYLILGFTLLTALILGSKLFGNQSVVPIAAGIILATLLMVSMYTFAVLRDDDLLSEQDTPDLAYYLGFSLTVAALSLTFLSDLMLSQTQGSAAEIAIIKGQLINRALSQFGAGLLATLFGLCAKIYLTSKQSNLAQDPSAVANKFRHELSEFSKLIDLSSNDLSTSIRLGCETINIATSHASISINSLAEQITRSSEVLALSFSAERLGSPVAAFIKEIETITTPLSNLRNGIGQLNSDVDRIRSSVDAFDTILKLSNNSIEMHTSKLKEVTTESEAFSNILGDLNKETKSLKSSIKSTSSTLGDLAGPTAALVPIFIETSNAVSNLSQISSGLVEVLKNSGKSTEKQIEQLSLLTGSTQSVNSALISLDNSAGQLASSFEGGQRLVANWTSELNSTIQAFSSVSNAASNLGNVILSSSEAHQSSEQVIRVSATSLSAFNSLISEVSAELNRVNIALENSKSAFLNFNVGLTPLANTAASLEPRLASLNTSLDTTKAGISNLNLSALELSDRLKNINVNSDRG